MVLPQDYNWRQEPLVSFTVTRDVSVWIPCGILLPMQSITSRKSKWTSLNTVTGSRDTQLNAWRYQGRNAPHIFTGYMSHNVSRQNSYLLKTLKCIPLIARVLIRLLIYCMSEKFVDLDCLVSANQNEVIFSVIT